LGADGVLRNPFHDNIVASASDDGKVFIWQVPDNFTLHTDAEEITDVSPVSKLAGHPRLVSHVTTILRPRY
jgi:coronin-1B/1C/6